MQISKYVLVFLLASVAFSSNAQFNRALTDSDEKLKAWFDSLFLKNDVSYFQSDEKKCAYNDSITNEFFNILHTDDAFNYPFDSLVKISKLTSTDSLLKIITWNIRFKGGKFKYYGFVLHRTSSTQTKSSVFKLTDKSDSIPDSLTETSTLTNTGWYGALYYQLHDYSYKGTHYYLLVGWDGYSNYVSRKLIDILYFNKRGKPIFGKNLFKSEQKTVKRLIFNYSIKATMACNYDKTQDAVIFDHLVPTSKIYTGMYEYYGPNGTFDGYFFNNGLWMFKEDIEPKNPRTKNSNPSKN